MAHLICNIYLYRIVRGGRAATPLEAGNAKQSGSVPFQ